MCGICGIINLNSTPVDTYEIESMMGAMKRRGPDDEGLILESNIGFGFVRLSILDLTMAGHQPMSSFDDNYVIIFNGEVYNYIEIRKELEGKYHFRSNTDTEVILNAFIEWGTGCLTKFNGMFAFAIYNKINRSVFIARDRFGIKPFYYHLSEDRFIFASDIPSILKVFSFKPTPNEGVICNYLLSNRTNYSEKTFFNEIVKLKPGHSLFFRENKISISRWYNIREEINNKGFKYPVEYYKLLEDSIKLQMRSDVPVGVSLSGGLDSSSIASILLKEFKVNDLHTYSAIYNKGDSGDESDFIDQFQNSGLIMHYCHPNPKELIQDLDLFVEALSEPITSTSEYAEFKVMELAKNHSTVVLNGQGVDEVLGGYDYFYGAYLLDLTKSFRIVRLIKEMYSLLTHGSLSKAIKYQFFYGLPVKLQSLFLAKKFPINKAFYENNKIHLHAVLKNLYHFKDLKDFFINHLEYKFEHHLLWADKSGMYFSLETRFPYIDHRIIEHSLATENDLVLNNGWSKYILREAMKNTVPEKIRMRYNKIGFETPEKEWYCLPEFQEFINELLNSTSFKNRSFFDFKTINKMVKLHFKGRKDYSQVIWKIIHLELWYRKFIDRRI